MGGGGGEEGKKEGSRSDRRDPSVDRRRDSRGSYLIVVWIKFLKSVQCPESNGTMSIA